jgi:hypothetical protein
MTITSAAVASRLDLATLQRKHRKYIRKLAAIKAAIKALPTFVPEVGEQVDALVHGGRWMQARFMSPADPETARPVGVHVFGEELYTGEITFARDIAPSGSRCEKGGSFEIGQCVDVLSVDGAVQHENLRIGKLFDGQAMVLIKGMPTCVSFKRVYPLGWFKHGRSAI